MISSIARVGAFAGVLALGSVAAPGAMTFTVTNQGGATAQMMNGISAAAALWSSRLSDGITVNLRVNGVPENVLGHSDTFYDPYTYSNVRAALVADKTSADDLSSTNVLQAAPAFSMLINKTANNPAGVVSANPYFDTGLGGSGQAGAENNSTVRITSANAKAIGLYPANSAGLDGTITFGTGIAFDFDPSNGISAGQVDFVGVAAHEIGHVLGFVSGVDILAGNAAAPGLNDNQLKFVTPLDLFRFSSRSIGSGGGVGVIDWTDDNTRKYFSVNGGVTSISDFSTGATFEASHWKDDLGYGLMDPTAYAGELLSITNTDLRAFDTIGYNLASVPEPSLACAMGLGALSIRRKRFARF